MAAALMTFLRTETDGVLGFSEEITSVVANIDDVTFPDDAARRAEVIRLIRADNLDVPGHYFDGHTPEVIGTPAAGSSMENAGSYIVTQRRNTIVVST